MYKDCWRYRAQNGSTGSILLFNETFATGEQLDMLKIIRDATGILPAIEMSGGAYKSTEPLKEQAEHHLGQKIINIGKPRLSPGQYHPRIWPQEFAPELNEILKNEFLSTIQAISSLFETANEIYRYVEPSPSNRLAYGHRIREVLMLACTEVESAWKAILVANGKCQANDNLKTSDYIALLPILHLSKWEVSLFNYPSYGSLAPFGSWSSPATTRTIPWYDAYNSTKHNREAKLNLANLDNMINALGAVFIMTKAQFGPFTEYEHDMHYPVPFRIIKEPQWPLEEQYIPPYPLPNQAFTWTPVPY